MKTEEKWENTGRDGLNLEDIMGLYEDGFEFVVSNGHITSVIFEQ